MVIRTQNYDSVVDRAYRSIRCRVVKHMVLATRINPNSDLARSANCLLGRVLHFDVFSMRVVGQCKDSIIRRDSGSMVQLFINMLMGGKASCLTSLPGQIS